MHSVMKPRIWRLHALLTAHIYDRLALPCEVLHSLLLDDGNPLFPPKSSKLWVKCSEESKKDYTVKMQKEGMFEIAEC